MGNDQIPIRISASGRISIPAAQRKVLGVEHGGLLVASMENGELRLRTVSSTLDELRARIGPALRAAGVSSQAVIDDRRAEAAQEAADAALDMPSQ